MQTRARQKKNKSERFWLRGLKPFEIVMLSLKRNFTRRWSTHIFGRRNVTAAERQDDKTRVFSR